MATNIKYATTVAEIEAILGIADEEDVDFAEGVEEETFAPKDMTRRTRREQKIKHSRSRKNKNFRIEYTEI